MAMSKKNPMEPGVLGKRTEINDKETISAAAKRLQRAAQQYKPEKTTREELLRPHLDDLEIVADVISEQELDIQEILKDYEAKEEVPMFNEPGIEKLRTEEAKRLAEYGIDDPKAVDFLYQLLAEKNRIDGENQVLIADLVKEAKNLDQNAIATLALTTPVSLVPIIGKAQKFNNLNIRETKLPRKTREVMAQSSGEIDDFCREALKLGNRLAKKFINSYAAKTITNKATGEEVVVDKTGKIKSAFSLNRENNTLAISEIVKEIQDLADFMESLIRHGIDFDGIIEENGKHILEAFNVIQEETGEVRVAGKKVPFLKANAK